MPGVVDNLGEDANAEELAGKLVSEARGTLDKSAHVAENTDKVMMAEVPQPKPVAPRPRRRIRIVSTPAGGGDIFAEPTSPLAGPSETTSVFQPSAPVGGQRRRRNRTLSTPISGEMFGDTAPVVIAPGQVLVNIMDSTGKKYPVKVPKATMDKISSSTAPLVLVEERKDANIVGSFLDGFIRKEGRQRAASNLSDIL